MEIVSIVSIGRPMDICHITALVVKLLSIGHVRCVHFIGPNGRNLVITAISVIGHSEPNGHNERLSN